MTRIGYIAGALLVAGSLPALGQWACASPPCTTNAAGNVWYTNGNVGIGTTTPAHLLHVAGTIGAKEVIVSSTGADYVFDSGYHLAALNEVAAYISEHHHLPDIPSASEVQQKGANVGEMQSKLLAKIEELTLHMIQAEERNNRLEQQNRDLSNGFPGWSRREAKLPGTNRHDRNGLHPLARLAVAPLVFIDRSLPD